MNKCANVQRNKSPFEQTQTALVTGKIGGGKSGALVFTVSDRSEASPKGILKVYLDAYTSTGDVGNERPHREIGTMCRLSGVMGYGTLMSSGRVSLDTFLKQAIAGCQDNDAKLLLQDMKAESQQEGQTYKRDVAWMITSMASGTPLLDLDLVENDDFAIGTLLEIIVCYRNAVRVIGKDFGHYDLHPDNIFVDTRASPRPNISLSRLSRTMWDMASAVISRHVFPDIRKLTGLAKLPISNTSTADANAIIAAALTQVKDLLASYVQDLHNFAKQELSTYLAIEGHIGAAMYHSNLHARLQDVRSMVRRASKLIANAASPLGEFIATVCHAIDDTCLSIVENFIQLSTDTIKFPKITIIDFDLASGFGYGSDLPEHDQKINHVFPITERALAFVKRWIPSVETVGELLHQVTRLVAELPRNQRGDVAHMVTYAFVLLSIRKRDRDSAPMLGIEMAARSMLRTTQNMSSAQSILEDPWSFVLRYIMSTSASINNTVMQMALPPSLQVSLVRAGRVANATQHDLSQVLSRDVTFVGRLVSQFIGEKSALNTSAAQFYSESLWNGAKFIKNADAQAPTSLSERAWLYQDNTELVLSLDQHIDLTCDIDIPNYETFVSLVSGLDDGSKRYHEYVRSLCDPTAITNKSLFQDEADPNRNVLANAIIVTRKALFDNAQTPTLSSDAPVELASVLSLGVAVSKFDLAVSARGGQPVVKIAPSSGTHVATVAVHMHFKMNGFGSLAIDKDDADGVEYMTKRRVAFRTSADKVDEFGINVATGEDLGDIRSDSGRKAVDIKLLKVEYDVSDQRVYGAIDVEIDSAVETLARLALLAMRLQDSSQSNLAAAIEGIVDAFAVRSNLAAAASAAERGPQATDSLGKYAKFLTSMIDSLLSDSSATMNILKAMIARMVTSENVNLSINEGGGVQVDLIGPRDSGFKRLSLVARATTNADNMPVIHATFDVTLRESDAPFDWSLLGDCAAAVAGGGKDLQANLDCIAGLPLASGGVYSSNSPGRRRHALSRFADELCRVRNASQLPCDAHARRGMLFKEVVKTDVLNKVLGSLASVAVSVHLQQLSCSNVHRKKCAIPGDSRSMLRQTLFNRVPRPSGGVQYVGHSMGASDVNDVIVTLMRHCIMLEISSRVLRREALRSVTESLSNANSVHDAWWFTVAVPQALRDTDNAELKQNIHDAAKQHLRAVVGLVSALSGPDKDPRPKLPAPFDEAYMLTEEGVRAIESLRACKERCATVSDLSSLVLPVGVGSRQVRDDLHRASVAKHFIEAYIDLRSYTLGERADSIREYVDMVGQMCNALQATVAIIQRRVNGRDKSALRNEVQNSVNLKTPGDVARLYFPGAVSMAGGGASLNEFVKDALDMNVDRLVLVHDELFQYLQRMESVRSIVLEVQKYADTNGGTKVPWGECARMQLQLLKNFESARQTHDHKIYLTATLARIVEYTQVAIYFSPWREWHAE